MCEAVVSQLREVLMDTRLGRGLYERLSHERDQGTPEAQASYADASLYDHLVRDRRIIVSEKRLGDLFDKHVFPRLPRPPAITHTDLEEVAFSQLGGVALGETFNAAYGRFVEHLLLRIPEEMEPVGDVDLGHWRKHGDAEDEGGHTEDESGHTEDEGGHAEEEEWLWSPSDGPFWFQVAFGKPPGMQTLIGARGLDALLAEPLATKGHGTLFGHASRQAMEEARREFCRLIPSVIRSIKLIAPLMLPKSTFIPKTPEAFVLAPCSLLTGGFGASFFSQCLSSYFAAPAKKTSMTQRMRNAVHLLVEADAQQNDTIALALCFSAIEALLCSKTDGIQDELAKNVTSLLLPEKTQRKVPEGQVKELYKRRSRALHGEAAIDDAPSHKAREVSSLACFVSTREAVGDAPRDKARRLAAAVLGALTIWNGYQHRMGEIGETCERGEFLKHLDDAVRGSPMIGVGDEFSGIFGAM